MNFLASLFKGKSSAPVARDRLQILLAHERTAPGPGGSDLLAVLREEILGVIAKHVPVDRDKVHIKLDRGGAMSILEVEVEIPTPRPGAAPVIPVAVAAERRAPRPRAKPAGASGSTA